MPSDETDSLKKETHRPLRILMVAPQFRPIKGGYERAAERLSKSLAHAGHEVEVVTERRQWAWPRHEVSEGITIRRIPVINRKGVHVMSSILSFFIFLVTKGRRFDVFHVHQYGWPAAIASAVGLLFGKSVLLKLTNTGQHGIDAVLPRGFTGALSRSLHRKISCCIVTSSRAEEEAQSFGFPKERICRIPNPLETEVFRPASPERAMELRSAFDLEDEFVAICAARLNPEKNHAMLIRAWNLFSKNFEKAKLILLGDGPLADEIRNLADNADRPETIMVHGPTDDPLPWYQIADTYTLSSDAEGLSNSLMEALSSGLSVISTRVSGSEDIFGEVDVGEIIPIGDHEAMAEALLALARDPERRKQCGQIAREYAIQNYSVDAIAEKMESCYLNCLGGGPLSPSSSARD